MSMIPELGFVIILIAPPSERLPTFLFLSLHTADQVEDLHYFLAAFFETSHRSPSGSYYILKSTSFLTYPNKGDAV